MEMAIEPTTTSGSTVLRVLSILVVDPLELSPRDDAAGDSLSEPTNLTRDEIPSEMKSPVPWQPLWDEVHRLQGLTLRYRRINTTISWIAIILSGILASVVEGLFLSVGTPVFVGFVIFWCICGGGVMSQRYCVTPRIFKRINYEWDCSVLQGECRHLVDVGENDGTADPANAVSGAGLRMEIVTSDPKDQRSFRSLICCFSDKPYPLALKLTAIGTEQTV